MVTSKLVFISHGEEDAATSFAKTVSETIGWTTHVPRYREMIELI